jgi:ABC-type sugar transport system ATPase subunit
MKSYGPVRVLKGVRLDLRAGEVHVLAGENGAGKSTLVRILSGLDQDYEGAVWTEGGVAVIHQELSLIGSMSVEDNIFLGREASRGPLLDRRQQRARALELCRSLGLEIDLAQAVEELPMSVRNRIEIAKALSQDARILIMDEPTSALTRPECARFFELIQSLKARGHGIIYISHKMEEIYQLADRITVLRDGVSVVTAAASELGPAELVSRMVGREIVTDAAPASRAKGEVVLKAEGICVPRTSGGASRSWLVEDASLEVRSGEIVGIAGLQGSCSSELFAGMFGCYGRETRGRIELAGRPFQIRSPRNSLAQGMALLTADRRGSGLVLGMSITENITLPSLKRFSLLGWLNRQTEKTTAQSAAERLRVRLSSVEQPVGELSGGNQQKVVLAKCLETRPKALLLDEPTRGVDVGAKHEIHQLLAELASSGMGILMISTELPELLSLCDRILVMHRGRITANFPRAEATQDRILRAAMGEVAA